MYCPNCEFEIKQEVTECPICGGELTLHPEEAPAAQPVALQTEDIPLDLSISNLILDAKQELDALDSMPGPVSFSNEPEPESLNLEALLSQDSDESPFQFPEVPSEPARADISPDTQKQQEAFLLPDDDPFRGNAGSWPPEQDASADTYPFSPETTMPEQKVFLKDSLFIDEAAPHSAPEESAPFIDEIKGKKLASALDSMAVPTQQPDAEPDRLFGRETPEPETGSIDFIPETQQHYDGAPDPFTSSDSEVPDFSLEAFEETPQAAGTGSGSKFRLTALVLLGVVIIAGAYVLADYFLQKTEPTEQIAKPAAPAVRKKAKPTVQNPEPAMPAPAALTEQSAPASAPDVAPTAAKPDKLPGGSARPQAAREQAAEPQPAPSTPDRFRTKAAPGQTEPQKTIEGKETAATAVAPVTSTPAIPAGPEKKTSSAPRVFSVHVFSFKTQQAAQGEIDRLNKRGFDAYLETVDLGAKGIWHRVKVGHYANRDEAEQARRDIKNKYPGIEPQLHMSR